MSNLFLKFASQACNAAASNSMKALGGNPNAVSAAAQTAQGQFNQGSANIANDLGSQRLSELYGFNSAQASIANDFTKSMWNQAAEWNEMMWQKNADWQEKMWQKSADFNSQEALKNRQWQQMMAETSYQRAVADMKKAGLNPILASGGVTASAGGSGSAASIGTTGGGAPSMGGATGQAASGAALNGIAASESNYTGQLDYLSGIMGLMSTVVGALSSAKKWADTNPVINNFYEKTIDTIDDMNKNAPWNKKRNELHEGSSGRTHGGGHGSIDPYAYGYDYRIDQ